MKLTMWRVLVDLNTYTKFRGKIVFFESANCCCCCFFFFVVVVAVAVVSMIAGLELSRLIIPA